MDQSRRTALTGLAAALSPLLPVPARAAAPAPVVLVRPPLPQPWPTEPVFIEGGGFLPLPARLHVIDAAGVRRCLYRDPDASPS